MDALTHCPSHKDLLHLKKTLLGVLQSNSSPPDSKTITQKPQGDLTVKWLSNCSESTQLRSSFSNGGGGGEGVTWSRFPIPLLHRGSLSTVRPVTLLPSHGLDKNAISLCAVECCVSITTGVPQCVFNGINRSVVCRVHDIEPISSQSNDSSNAYVMLLRFP